MRVLQSMTVFILAFSSLALASSRSQRARGASVFAESGCQHCHSIHNVGGHKGPDLIRCGQEDIEGGNAPADRIRHKVMPAFKDDLDPDELNDLIAYLKSCREKPAKQPRAANSN